MQQIWYLLKSIKYTFTAKMGKSKACKNAFFFFMMELKSKQGRNFKNNEEVAKAADPLWKVNCLQVLIKAPRFHSFLNYRT